MSKIKTVQLINGKLCYETSDGGGGYIPAEWILKLAALEAVAEASRKSEKILSGKIPRGETLHEKVYKAKEVLLDALKNIESR